MINVKKKGNKGENDFANFLHENGLKAWRNGSSGAGQYKGDINNSHDLCIEVKTVKKLNLQDAWYQVQSDSSKSHTIPLLAIHYDGMGKNQWLIVQHSEDWIENFNKLNGK